MRYAAKVDANHPEIVQHLRLNEWGVYSAARLGGGFPDLICARLGFTALVEIKAERGELNPEQVRFHAEWPGVVLTVRSPEDALAKLNAALVLSGACKLEDIASGP